MLAVVAATVLLSCPAADAGADPTPPPVDGSKAVVFPVLAFDGRTLGMTFPQASIDGSVTEDGTVITLKADVFFAYNKATLNAKAGAALDRARTRLTDLGATRVRVSGYTDARGSAAYNLGLSRRRAEAVRAALAKRLPGVAYEVRAFGERSPVATNKTANGRALNRRVTITVTA